jgi:hypothetical protein
VVIIEPYLRYVVIFNPEPKPTKEEKEQDACYPRNLKIRLITKPYKRALRLTVDVTHELHLLFFFSKVALIDTNGVDPDSSTDTRIAKSI